METKAFGVEQVQFKAEPEGTFTARIVTLDKPDKSGDVIRPGAFAATIADRRASGTKWPLIFSHLWTRPEMFVGEVDALEETATDVRATGHFYLAEPMAQKIFQQLQRKTIKEWSFGYIVTKAKALTQTAREIFALDVIEVGPTLLGMGDTATLSVKGVTAAEVSAMAKARLTAHRRAIVREQLVPVERELHERQQRWKLARAEQDLVARQAAR